VRDIPFFIKPCEEEGAQNLKRIKQILSELYFPQLRQLRQVTWGLTSADVRLTSGLTWQLSYRHISKDTWSRSQLSMTPLTNHATNEQDLNPRTFPDYNDYFSTWVVRVQEFLCWVEFEYNDSWYSNLIQERGHSTHETWVKLEYNVFFQT
jgi:hypothetical protein